MLGGTGQLGRALVEALRARDRDFSAPPRSAVDLADLRGLPRALRALKPAAVINAAAYTDVAGAERPEERPRVDLLNRDAVRALGDYCSAERVRLAHVSTDYVFDGRAGRPYREDDPTNPLQVYGRSKLEGEEALRQVCPDALIARTSTLFGPGPRARPHFVEAILAQVLAGKHLSVVDPPVSSPTYAPDLARGVIDLLDCGATGTVHVANAGSCTRRELAEEVVRAAGREGAIRVERREETPGGLARPAYSVLDTSRFHRWVGRPMRPWQETVRDYVASRTGGAG